MTNTATPCIGICSTIYGDDVCRGCKRTYQEVIDWNGYSPRQKADILQRLNQQGQQVLSQFFEVFDASRLQAKLSQHHISVHPAFSPSYWAYTLLREGADKIHDLSKYGIAANAPYAKFSPMALFQACDDALFSIALEGFRTEDGI